MVSTQVGAPQFERGEVAATLSYLEDAGLHANFYNAVVPTYHGGYMTFGFGAHKLHWSLPKLETLEHRFCRAGITAKHYSPGMHLASFAVPPWIEDEINAYLKKKMRYYKINHLDSDYFSMCSSTGDQFAGRHILADF